jgi:hypothetical protein
MAKTKKRTAAQRIVGLATTGMPAPIKMAAGSRLGAPLTLLVAGGLVATGIVTIQWTGGLPKVSVDRQRAEQVTETVKQRVESAWDQENQPPGAQPSSGTGQNFGSGQAFGTGQNYGAGQNYGTAPGGYAPQPGYAGPYGTAPSGQPGPNPAPWGAAGPNPQAAPAWPPPNTPTPVPPKSEDRLSRIRDVLRLNR